jgi:hypothetical protein
MLDVLFGNKTIGKVMLFLLVNEKGYAAQIHHLLKIPLTPVQQALKRLEKGEVLTSFFEGKTKLFCFNEQFVFKQELELLLKKYYGQLSVQEKKLYLVSRSKASSQPAVPSKFIQEKLLKEVWEKIKQIRHVFFSAKIKSNLGANLKGKGDVQVTLEDPFNLVFREKGKWKNTLGQEFDFNNSYRWRWNPDAKVISLEHLRFGLERPVFLLDLIPTSENILESLHPHLCQEDTYIGRIVCDPDFIQLSWRVLGPKKNDEIVSIYT